MKTTKYFLLLILFVTYAFAACNKSVDVQAPPPPPPPPVVDTINALKDATDFTIGVAVSHSGMVSNTAYSGTVKRDFDGVTFENLMKHYSIVQSDGTMNFTRTDELLNASAGLQIFGHTLGWHQGQNASYLKNFSGITGTSSMELLSNPGFESGLTGWSTYNTGEPAGSATISAGSGTSEVRSGTGSLKVINPTAYTGNQWRVQVASELHNTTVGRQYTFSYWVKAASANGSIRLSTAAVGGGGSQYQGDQPIGTQWQQVTWTITANSTQTRFLFDLGQVANTYFIDDASLKEIVSTGSGSQIAAKLDQALDNFISSMVSRYKDKVKAWDVINELFTEAGAIRNNFNTPTSASDAFVWSHYLGRDYALKAFNYAKAADPSALLFINDYNLEASSAKLDSLIAMVAELKSKGAKIDGIGTQMHISWNSSLTAIDNMMKKLAATGLLIRISELDVRMNVSSTAGYVFNAAEATKQADMYRYVVKSYLTNIPKAQRHGITLWGVSDNTSWLYNNGLDFPLLYNADFTKKPAYTAVLDALKGK